MDREWECETCRRRWSQRDPDGEVNRQALHHDREVHPNKVWETSVAEATPPPAEDMAYVYKSLGVS